MTLHVFVPCTNHTPFSPPCLRRPPDVTPTAHRQARVSMPGSVSDAEPDRRQWLKQQSRSRRRRRSSSGKLKKRSSTSSSSAAARGRPASAYDDLPSSRDSSLAGDDDSDASSVVSTGSSISVTSTNSRLSIVSTPDLSSWRQRQMKQQQHQRVKSSERASSVSGFSARRNSLTSSSLSLSGLQAYGGGGGGGGMQPRGSLSRTSSSSSISSMLSSSLLRWCSVCEAEFTRLRRPHRCRQCLEAVCAPCSPARLPVPGSGSGDPKRTCKLCARESLAPQVDAVVSPERSSSRAAVPVVPASPAGSVRSISSRSSRRRSASIGNIARAPFGVLSKPADPVLYPAAVSGAADAAAAGGARDSGSVGVGEGSGGNGHGSGSEAGDGAGIGDNDFGLGEPAAYFQDAEDARHDTESERWESAEEGDREDWPSVAAMTARIENPAAAAAAELDDAAGGGSPEDDDAGLEDAEGESSVPLDNEATESGAEAPATAAGTLPSGDASELDGDGDRGEDTPLAVFASSGVTPVEAGREAVETPPTALSPPSAMAGLAEAETETETETSARREEEQPKRGIFGILFGRTPSKAKMEVSEESGVYVADQVRFSRVSKGVGEGGVGISLSRPRRGSRRVRAWFLRLPLWPCNSSSDT